MSLQFFVFLFWIHGYVYWLGIPYFVIISTVMIFSGILGTMDISLMVKKIRLNLWQDKQATHGYNYFIYLFVFININFI